jgi:CheY-like chemotaxis protein
LLAEDDDNLRELALNVLEKSGYTVLAAKDGEDAIRLFQENAARIDLAVLDVVMPKQNGRMVYDRIRIDRPELPIMFSTGYGFNVLKNIHLPDDGSQLIRKPYSPRYLLTKVREVLDAAPSRRTTDLPTTK